MMIFHLFLTDDITGAEISQLDVSLSDGDYQKIARRAVRILNGGVSRKRNLFSDMGINLLITALANENIVAFTCGILQINSKKKMLTGRVNSFLEQKGMFFRLRDYVIDHR